MVPVTKASGKSRVVQFRFACNKHDAIRHRTGLLLSRSIDVSGRTNTIGTNGLKGTVTLKRFELWERSG